MAPRTLIPCSSASRWNYDVYLSYERGESGSDFATNLHAFLERCNIKTFKDDGHMKRGEHLSATLMKGIKESRIAIIIYSRNYASSRRCLEENVLIMECREELGQKVFPVFLMGVDGSDVRRQNGCFEEPFHLHQEMFDPEIVDKWKSALTEAGGICGWNLKDVPVPAGHEPRLALTEDIVTELRITIMAASSSTDVPFTSFSSSASPRTDVFLCFRGIDTRQNFTRDLYRALVFEGIETFKADETIKIGENIYEAIAKAIKESRFAIIILSRNFATSIWCLEELALIMERWDKHEVNVFPVFLEGVDRLEVQYLKGSFGEPFGRHEKPILLHAQH